MWQKLKSKLLTKLFIDWVHDEWDIDTLIQTRLLIQQRETQLKAMIDISTRVEVNGFKQMSIN